MPLVQDLLASPSVTAELRKDALRRIYSDPGLPNPVKSTSPFWLNNLHPVVSGHQSESLPQIADYVIIGSGITGASVAYNILEECQARGTSIPSIVVTEARDVCSGATGRNGGHVMETVSDYSELKESFGKEAAMKIIKFRLAHLPALETLAGSYPEGLRRSQIRKVMFVAAYFEKETFENAAKCLAEFKRDMPEESRDFEMHQGDTLQTQFRLSNHAYGVMTGPSGAAWPYQLVTMIFADLLEKYPSHFFLESSTPITKIQTSSSSEPHPYILNTPRGTIRAANVVHCTNGHVSHLVSGFAGRVFPLRGQMSAQGPGSKFGNLSDQNSWLLIYKHGFDYLTQLPDDQNALSDGEMMLGGGLASTAGHGVEEIGVANDDSLNLYADIHLGGALSAAFDRDKYWGSSIGVKQMWTGIMGFSADGLPWVGKLPSSLTRRETFESCSEWAAVGFSGEGMVHTWLAGKALATMILGDRGCSSTKDMDEMKLWMPEEFCISEERINQSVMS